MTPDDIIDVTVTEASERMTHALCDAEDACALYGEPLTRQQLVFLRSSALKHWIGLTEAASGIVSTAELLDDFDAGDMFSSDRLHEWIDEAGD